MKLAFVIAILLVPVAFGQTLPKDSKKVPPSFKGNDAKLIARSLLTSPLYKRKDEFETSAAYEARTNNLAAATLGDGTKADSELVFKLAEFRRLLDLTKVSYDADAELLTLTLDVKEFTDLVGKSNYNATVALAPSDYRDLGKYIGENSFGVKREISRSEFDQYRLVVNNLKDFPGIRPRSIGYEAWKIPIKMPATQARDAKDVLAILYFARLVKPYLGLDFFDKKPKIDSPSEISSTTYYLYANVSEIWIFNSLTGEIYTKIRAGDPGPAQPPTILQ